MKYFQEKVRIDKAKTKSVAYKIQFFNNGQIDDYVKSFNDGNPEKPTDAMLWAELAILNKPEVYRNYNRIINSKYTSNDNLNKMLIRNKANKDLNRIVEAELERIVKNLNYVEQVLSKYEVPQKEYEKLIRQQKESSLANRRQILEKVAIQANNLLVSEGLNIPSHVFTYRDLEGTARSMIRSSQMQSKFEEIKSINDNYRNEGKSDVYTEKVWIHTHGGKTTRHMSNHMQTVNIDEPFIVVNDATLEIDEMMYPMDPAGSPGNAYCCWCEMDFK